MTHEYCGVAVKHEIKDSSIVSACCVLLSISPVLRLLPLIHTRWLGILPLVNSVIKTVIIFLKIKRFLIDNLIFAGKVASRAFLTSFNMPFHFHLLTSQFLQRETQKEKPASHGTPSFPIHWRFLQEPPSWGWRSTG